MKKDKALTFDCLNCGAKHRLSFDEETKDLNLSILNAKKEEIETNQETETESENTEKDFFEQLKEWWNK